MQDLSFEKMLKGYLGFLKGTGKSALTISSYQGDLKVFQEFLRKESLSLNRMEAKHFDDFHYFLRKRGLKMNTRRRKIITARALFRFALSRKKLEISPARFVRSPERLDRLPWIPSSAEVKKFLQFFSTRSPLGMRNRIMAELLAETAISVSELCRLAWQDVNANVLQIPGKRSRSIMLSSSLERLLAKWKKVNSGKYLFPGYNRHGVSTEKISPRGVEIVFRKAAERTKLDEFQPKCLRHYVVLEWLKKSVAEAEIQRRLGVCKTYSFHAYKQYLGT